MVLDDVVTLKFTRLIDNRLWEHLVVGINFTGGMESRLVTALVFLEPYESQSIQVRFYLEWNLICILTLCPACIYICYTQSQSPAVNAIQQVVTSLNVLSQEAIVDLKVVCYG